VTSFPARLFFCLALFFPWSATSQTVAPVDGEVTVRFTQGLDSASERPGQASQAVVVRSTNPAVPRGAVATVQLQQDPGGMLTIHLVQLGNSAVASSAVALTGFSKALSFARQPGAPPNSVSGARVFVPQNTEVRFTLAVPAKAPAPVTVAPASPRALAAWRIGPQRPQVAGRQGQEADLMGTVNAAGKTGAVQLAVICTEKDPLRVVQGELRVELRLRSSLVPPPSGDFGCDGDIDGSNAGAHTKIGSGEE